ncbi:hypothetical protein BDV59DRAFT_163150 [Aspergillus ambiguus]|uniref:uncharacterized protein n=1 Tax=Aspergillus ambiguus TaxID=176160 RepID=UPI003CCC9EB6
MACLISSTGAYISRPWKQDPGYIRVCLLAPGNAGKTTLLYRLLRNENFNMTPTLGLHCVYCGCPFIPGLVQLITSQRRSFICPRKAFIFRSGI